MDTVTAERRQMHSEGTRGRRDTVADYFLSSPLLWGGLAALIFYWTVRKLPGFSDWGQTLFCGHPLAYATTALFWIGMASLAVRVTGVPRERRAIRDMPENLSPAASGPETAEILRKKVEQSTRGFRESLTGERLTGVAEFVAGRRSADGLNAHLQYLAEFAGERLHHSYGLVRTITWAVPILGFLGTVIGITQAIQNLDPAELQSSFGMVAEGLGVAFGTTALSLGLSLLLVFGTYLVEKQERFVLAEVESRTLELTTRLFPAAAGSHPVMDAGSEAAQQILAQTKELITQHVAAWTESLSDMRDEWNSVLRRQQSELDAAMKTAFDQSVGGQVELIRQQRAAQELLQRSVEQLSETQTGLLTAQQQLVDAQRQILERLEADPADDGLKETLHTLSAAVHLLTARVTPRAA